LPHILFKIDGVSSNILFGIKIVLDQTGHIHHLINVT
jgi:hypothetical protein